MRAFVLTAPGEFDVQDVPPPSAEPGEAVIEVERAGICGTDVELFEGVMPYQQQGFTTYPLRPGHEWCGRVIAVGAGVDEDWLGRRVAGDTMIGDGTCRRCRRGAQHMCDNRHEVGVRDGRPGALAEQLAVPVRSLHRLPDAIDAAMGALVEPGGNALRAAQATNAKPGDRVLVVGPGTIGTLIALFLRPTGAEVHLLGQNDDDLGFVRSLGFDSCWTRETLPDVPFDAIVDATNSHQIPDFAVDRVEPAGRVVLIGLAGSPTELDSRTIALKDITVVGVLSASPGLAEVVETYASGAVDPRPLVAATVGLDEVGGVLSGDWPAGAGTGPKIHVDPHPGTSG